VGCRGGQGGCLAKAGAVRVTGAGTGIHSLLYHQLEQGLVLELNEF